MDRRIEHRGFVGGIRGRRPHESESVRQTLGEICNVFGAVAALMNDMNHELRVLGHRPLLEYQCRIRTIKLGAEPPAGLVVRFEGLLGALALARHL